MLCDYQLQRMHAAGRVCLLELGAVLAVHLHHQRHRRVHDGRQRHILLAHVRFLVYRGGRRSRRLRREGKSKFKHYCTDRRSMVVRAGLHGRCGVVDAAVHQLRRWFIVFRREFKEAVVTVSTLLLTLCLGQAVPTLGDITPEDITALFMENALRAQTLRVESTVTETSTANKIEFYKARIALAATAPTRADIPPEWRARIAADAKSDAETLESLRTTARLTCRQDYWSDRSNFQMRAPVDRKLGGWFSFDIPPDRDFPDIEATRDELVPAFSDIFVLSCGPATQGRVRIWEAMILLGDHHSGRVLFKNSERHCHFPPLALPSPEWGGIPNPIDEFYIRFLQQGRAKIIGEFEIDGANTVLIEVHIEGASARAFVDLAQAAMPRRIEFFLGDVAEYSSHIGLCIDHPQLWAVRIVSDIALEEIEDGGVKLIYPVSGLESHLSRSASAEQAVSKAHPEEAVHEEWRWNVESVEINRVMSKENFALAFPPNTIFVNQPTNELLLTGDVEGYTERVIQESLGYNAASFWQGNLVVVLGALGALIVAAAFIRFRRSKATREMV